MTHDRRMRIGFIVVGVLVLIRGAQLVYYAGEDDGRRAAEARCR